VHGADRPVTHLGPGPQVSARGGVAEVTINWELVSGADSYNVYWSLKPGVTLDSNQMSATTSPLVHASLADQTTYYYALTAVNPSRESALSDEVSATT
jgi:hypothetical protein